MLLITQVLRNIIQANITKLSLITVKPILINKKYIDAFLNRSLSKTEIGDIKGDCADARKAKSLGYKSVENEKWIKENCISSFKFF